MLQGKIIKGIGGFYYVKTDSAVYSCRARGKFRNKSLTPIVGDTVNIDVTDTEKMEGYVVDILPRKNELFRPMVSNIDLLLITFAAASPEPSLSLIDKLTVTALSRNIPVAICPDRRGRGAVKGSFKGKNHRSCRKLRRRQVKSFKRYRREP